MEGLLMVLAVSVTAEALVEYIKLFWKLFGKKRSRAIVTRLIAVAVGVTLSLLCAADLYAALGITFLWKPLGCILTGVFASRGANFINQLVSRLEGKTTTAAPASGQNE